MGRLLIKSIEEDITICRHGLTHALNIVHRATRRGQVRDPAGILDGVLTLDRFPELTTVFA